MPVSTGAGGGCGVSGGQSDTCGRVWLDAVPARTRGLNVSDGRRGREPEVGDQTISLPLLGMNSLI